MSRKKLLQTLSVSGAILAAAQLPAFADAHAFHIYEYLLGVGYVTGLKVNTVVPDTSGTGTSTPYGVNYRLENHYYLRGVSEQSDGNMVEVGVEDKETYGVSRNVRAYYTYANNTTPSYVTLISSVTRGASIEFKTEANSFGEIRGSVTYGGSVYPSPWQSNGTYRFRQVRAGMYSRPCSYDYNWHSLSNAMYSTGGSYSNLPNSRIPTLPTEPDGCSYQGMATDWMYGGASFRVKVQN